MVSCTVTVPATLHFTWFYHDTDEIIGLFSHRLRRDSGCGRFTGLGLKNIRHNNDIIVLVLVLVLLVVDGLWVVVDES